MHDGERAKRERFEALTMTSMRSLYAFAVRLARDSDRASDLVQEAYLRAFRTFDNFREGTNARAWLFKILYSVHLNRLKRDARRPTTISMESAEEGGKPLEIEDATGLVAIVNHPALTWEGSEVERALAGLDRRYRSAIVLVDIGDLTYEEAADVLDCPVGTVRSRLARGRRALARQLHDFARMRGLVKE